MSTDLAVLEILFRQFSRDRTEAAQSSAWFYLHGVICLSRRFFTPLCASTRHIVQRTAISWPTCPAQASEYNSSLAVVGRSPKSLRQTRLLRLIDGVSFRNFCIMAFPGTHFTPSKILFYILFWGLQWALFVYGW